MKLSPCQSCQKEPEVIQETRSFVICCRKCNQEIWNDTRWTWLEAVRQWNVVQKNRGPIMLEDLSIARFLFQTACEADAWMQSARTDGDNDLASSMEALSVRAKSSLRKVCGRPFEKIRDRDLDTQTFPGEAAWTQLPYDERTK